jgi:hypothetical protein
VTAQHESDRRERRHPRRHLARVAQGRAARQARAQVRPQHRNVARARLAVRQSRQQWRQPLALRARLDALHAPQEAPPALRQAAIHLCVREAGQLLDLPVRVALGEEQHAADLLGLQPAQRLRPDLEPLESLGLLVGRSRAGARDPVGFSRLPGSLTLAVERVGLVLDDGLEPGHEVVRARGRRLREQDLEPALVGVLRVLARVRVAPGGGHDLGPVEPHEVDRDGLDLRARRPVRRAGAGWGGGFQ